MHYSKMVNETETDTEFVMPIKIHVLHCGKVCVSPDLPFGGDSCSLIKASGLFCPKDKRLWLPVSAYLIEHPKGLILLDTGWDRAMSPNGEFDAAAQVKSLGSRLLYKVNQGALPIGESVAEQLAERGIVPSDLDYVLLSHLDCDHANGLPLVSDAKRIMVSAEELAFAHKHRFVRYRSKWWSGVSLEAFDWTGSEDPAGKSYDLFGDGTVRLINIPGHADGLFAVKIVGASGRFALLFSDGGYASRSWQEMITSGIAADKQAQKRSLAWIREQSLSPQCIESLANHDPDIKPHTIVVE